MLLFEKMSKSIGKCRWFSKAVWYFSLSMIKSPYNLLSKVKSSSNKISAKSYWYRSSRPEVFCKKKMFLKISQNPQENACARSRFNKVAGLRSATLLKERLWHRCFLVNFTKFLETPFFIEYLWWLLLAGTQTLIVNSSSLASLIITSWNIQCLEVKKSIHIWFFPTSKVSYLYVYVHIYKKPKKSLLKPTPLLVLE